ncbi:MAG: cobalamin-dependent protein [Myxococcota bacterium]|nr:cobalamin-dependent protein [Myxococcota bacterium]
MARILLTAAPWTYREIRFADGHDGWREFLGTHLFRRESTINGKMPFWSLLYLAGWLEREGHQVHYLESYGTPEESWFREIEIFDPDVIGLNTVTCTWAKTQEVLGRLKRAHPEVLTVLGGAHTNVAKAGVLDDCPDLDVAVFGEGELTLQEIVEVFSSGSRDFSGVKGCAWRNASGEVVKECQRPLIDDVDRLPFPARALMRQPELYNPRLNIYNRPSNTVIFTGRGCPLTCASCHLPAIGSLKFRIRSPQHVFAEMSECEDRWGITDFGFYDHFGIFSSQPDKALELCELILASGRRWTWTVTFWSYDFTAELLDMMSRAGCWRIDTVLISGVDRNLRTATMDSPLTVEQCEAGVHRIHEAGIEIAARLSLGIEGETTEEARETIDYACRLPLEWAFFTPVNPVFGSRLWRRLNKADRFVQDDRSMNIFNVFYSPTGMSRDELKSLQREAYRRFYGRPAFAGRKLMQLRDPGAVRRNATLASHLGRHLMGF